MPEKSFIIYLDDYTLIRVYFLTNKNDVETYVVKLVTVIEGIEYEIIRFDSHHNHAHMDILLPDGSLGRKVWLSDMNNKNALNNAVEEIQKNYEIYLERFKKWLKEKKVN